MWTMCISLLVTKNKANQHKAFNVPVKEKDEVDKKNKTVDKERKDEETGIFYTFLFVIGSVVKNMLKDLWISTKRLFEQKIFHELLISSPHTTENA